MTPEAQWEEFLDKYLPETAELARQLLTAMRKLTQGAVEMVYDNYNFLVIGFGPTEKASQAVISLAVAPLWVTVCFLQGAKLPDPTGILKGEGNQVRHVRIASLDEFFMPAVQDLIHLALNQADPSFDTERPSRMVIKSVSAKQRPRRPKGQ